MDNSSSIRRIRHSSYRQPTRATSHSYVAVAAPAPIPEEAPVEAPAEDPKKPVIPAPSNIPRETDKGGVVELTVNARYCVSKLPATPPVLISKNSERLKMDVEDFDYEDEDEVDDGETVYEGSADQNTNFALALTGESCYVWNYTSPDHIASTLVFPSAPAGSDALAVLVAPAPGSQEPGLVSVVSDSGILTYWEAVGGAVADGLLRRGKSSTHKVGLYAGEVIEHLQVAEPAGVVLATSSGRYVLVTLRDLHGHQAISSTTMRGGSAGLLSSIKNAIVPTGTRRGIVSVKAGAIIGRTERQVLFLNRRGDLSVWECSRAGRSRLLFQATLYDMMLNNISAVYADAHATFAVHDVEIYDDEKCIFILTSFERSDDEFVYILFTISIDPETFALTIVSTHRLQMFTGISTRTPRLVFPKPHKTLFVVFSSAVVLIDALKSYTASGGIPRRWQDVISFRSGLEIIGASQEDVVYSNSKIARHCGVVLLLKGVGTVRIEKFPDSSATSSGDLMQQEEALEPELAKSRIEQAVFYSTEDNTNPLSFGNRPEITFDKKILENAFLQVSKEILETNSVYVPPVLPSLSEHLSLRVLYLTRLGFYLHANFVRELSIAARFSLLWDLEKISTAKALWSHVDSKLQTNSGSVVLRVLESHAVSGSDGVREWFLHQVPSIGNVIVEVAKECVSNPSRDGIREGNEVILASILNGALAVNSQLGGTTYYLFEDDSCESDPWTCSAELINAVEGLYQETAKLVETSKAVEFQDQIVQLIETLCSLYTTRLSWLTNRDADHRQVGALSARYTEQRSAWIRLLVKADRVDEALRISEKFEIHRSLVEILVENWALAQSAHEEVAAGRFHDQIKKYIEQFGYTFAGVLYQYFVETKRLKLLLTEFGEYHMYLDRYLSTGRLNRISWVRDIRTGEYEKASGTLVDVAVHSEELNANRKLQLSIAKLCALAQPSEESNESSEQLQLIESRLLIVKTQESLERQIEAAVNLESGGLSARYNVYADELTTGIRGLSATQTVVKRGLRRLVAKLGLSAEELVDILTLIDTTTKQSEANFYLAFKLCELIPETTKELTERLVSQRLLLRDDWKKIVDTKQRSDAKVQAVSEKTLLYKTIKQVADANDNLSQAARKLLLDPKLLSEPIDKRALRQRYSFLDDAELTALHSEANQQATAIGDLGANYGLGFWSHGIYSRIRALQGRDAVALDA